MKISFSTLACPAWNLEQAIAMASREGYDGIELRFLENDDRLWLRPEFCGSGLARTRERLGDLGLKIPCVDTSCFFHHPDASLRRQSLEAGKSMMELAAALGAGGIRVFGDRVQPGADHLSTSSWIAEGLRALAEFGSPLGVQVWLESHGDFARASDTLEVIALAAHENIGVLWDPANAFTDYGETPAVAFSWLRSRIRHVHLKDAIPPRNPAADGQPAPLWDPVLMGEGNFPAGELLQLLQGSGYQRYISFEWEKRWHPEIPEPEIALPHFRRWIKAALANSPC
jgi:sugar phosphate isomerase/epimerase